MRHDWALLILAGGLTMPAQAQFTQQGAKLVGTGAMGSVGEQGNSVAVSADGNTALVGAPGDAAGIGAAWVFTRSGNSWAQQGSKLVGSGVIPGTSVADQGLSVALSADGNTAIIGGPPDSGSVGAAWVFFRSGGVWTEQAKLVGSGAVRAPQQGYSVALSADGNTALVGGPYDNANAGAVWVFTRSQGIWSQQGNKLVGNATSAEQGWSVALSADGNTALVGGYADSNDAGALWVFTRSGGVWAQQGGKLIASDAAGSAGLGWSVALSGDGNTAVAVGAFDNNGAGATWVFTRSGDAWSQQGGKLVVPGGSVAISGDGNTVMVGGGGDNNGTGAAWAFKPYGGVWVQQGSKLVATDGVWPALGRAVALSGDGTTAVLGGPSDNNEMGATWVFVASGQGGPPALSAAKTHTGDFAVGQTGAAYTVTVSNAALTSPTTGVVTVTDNIPGGMALVSMTGTGWTCQSNICTRSDVLDPGQSYSPITVQVNVLANVPSQVTNQVSVSGGGSNPASASDTTNIIVLPAPVLVSPANGASGVSLLPLLTWSAVTGASSYDVYLGTTPTPPFAANTTSTSYAPATMLNPGTTYYWRVVARNSGGSASSATWSYTTMATVQGQFVQQGGKLVGTGWASISEQGEAVALSADGNTVIVGAVLDNNTAGAAWVFTRASGVWTQQGAKLIGTGAVGNAFQGSSVALSADGNTAIAGGTGDNSNVGAAWVFTRSGGVWTQQGGKLVGSGTVSGTVQGSSVALSGDGNTAIVGGGGDTNGTGAAWVYTRSEGVWTQHGKLVGSGAVGAANQAAVALSADGNTAILGGSGDNYYHGAVWVFTRSGGVWTEQGGKLVGSGAVDSYGAGAAQGTSVALSADGNTAVIGGQRDNGFAGAAWVFTRVGDNWTQQGSKLVGTPAIGSARQGTSVSVSADGNTALVGGNMDNNGVGASWMFTRSGGVWSQLGGKLVGDGAVGQSVYQGNSVALSADGRTAMIGGSYDNNGLGAAWPFVASGLGGGPSLSVTKTHTGNLTQGQIGAAYAVTVSNAASAAATSSTVVVNDIAPVWLTLVSMSGAGWTCSSTICTRSDVLAPGSTYPPITVLVNVSPRAPSQVTNQVMAYGGGAAAAAAGDVATAIPMALSFYPMTPCRVADTRGNGKTGAFGPPGISGGAARDFPILAGGCNIPTTATAYSLNVTAVPPGQLTYLSMWPAGQTQPVVSTLNDFSTQASTPGNVVANAAIVPAGTSGSVSVYVSDTTDVIIDINGYFAPPGTGGLAFYPVTPCRVADTRGNGKSGAFGPPTMAGGTNRNFPLQQTSCSGIPATAQAYSLNMTVVPQAQLTYLTTWPSGQSMPVASTLNDFSTQSSTLDLGRAVANAAIVPAGASGAVSVYVSDSTDVIIDINGYFAPPGSSGALSFYTAAPCRVVDTRGNGLSGQFGPPSMTAGATRTFPLPASTTCTIPASAQAYSLNMTVAPPNQVTYLTTWPSGQTQPVVSTLNDFSTVTAIPGRVVANAAIVPAGGSGGVNVFVSDASDVIIDINGYFAP